MSERERERDVERDNENEEESQSLDVRTPYVQLCTYGRVEWCAEGAVRPPVHPATRFVVVFKVYKLLWEDAAVRRSKTSDASTAPEFRSLPTWWSAVVVDRTFAGGSGGSFTRRIGSSSRRGPGMQRLRCRRHPSNRVSVGPACRHFPR